MSETAASAETLAASSTKLAPHAVMHHSAAVVQKSIPAATQNAPGSLAPTTVGATDGASTGTRRLPHHVSAGTASEASKAVRQPAPVAAASDSAPISTTYAMLAATLASVSATARCSPWWSERRAWIVTSSNPPDTP